MYYPFTYFPIKIVENEARRLAEELRLLFALTEDPGSISCTHKAVHNFNSSPKGSNTILLVLHAPRTHDTKTYIQGIHPYTSKIYVKKVEKKILISKYMTWRLVRQIY